MPRRRHGCLAWLFGWWFLLTGWLIRSAHARARALFADPVPGQIDEPAVVVVQRARAVAGVLATVLVLGPEKATDSYLGISLNNLLLLPVVLLLSGPVIVAVFIRCAPQERRATLRQRLRAPLVRAGTYVGILTLFILAFWQYQSLILLLPDSILGALLQILISVAGLWVTFLWLFASFYGGRGLFAIAGVHAALPAVLTAVLVWEMAVIGLFAYGPGPGPLWWQLASCIGGPASVTAVALWELRWLRTRHSIRIRA